MARAAEAAGERCGLRFSVFVGQAEGDPATYSRRLLAGLNADATRSGLVLDPEHGLLKQLLPPFRLGAGGPIAGGHQYMPWIHIEDEVRLFLWALDTTMSPAAIRLRRQTRRGVSYIPIVPVPGNTFQERG